MGGFSLHHYVRPQNINELKVIHGEARPSAVFYISTILSLYLLGLLVILVHYMNSCYGAWNWSFGDVWREIRPRTLGSKKSPKDDPESPRSPVSPTAGNGGAANGEHHHEGCPLYRYGAKSQPRNNPARRTTSSSTLSSSSSHKRRNNCDLEAAGVDAETPPPPPFSPGANSEDGKLVPRVKEEEEEARVEEELRRIWTRSRRSIIRKWSSLRGKRGEREVFLHPGRNNNINVSQNGHSSANTNSSTGCHSTSNAATNTSHPNNQEQSSQFSMVSNSSGVRRSTSGRVCTCGITSKRTKREEDDEEEDDDEEIVGKVSTVATTTVEIHAGNGSNQV